MTHAIRLLGLAVLLVLAVAPTFAGDDVTLEGSFIWAREDGERNGALRAVFTPTGKGEWDVAFHFDWEDAPRVFSGTCSGSLDGELAGNVVSDGERKMNFRFTGKFEDGTFSGTHGLVTDEGGIRDSGTLTLSSKG